MPFKKGEFKHSEQFKQRLSLTRKGKGNPFYGKAHSKEQKEKWSKERTGPTKETAKKISKALLGRAVLDETKKKISKSLRGRIGHKWSEEEKRKLSKILKGRKPSIETREKMSIAWETRIVSMKTREKMSKARQGKRMPSSMIFKISGKNHYNWKGGISRIPYSFDWTNGLKKQILQRDDCQCQNPGCLKRSEELCIHHINYNKKDCNIDNLITLCRSCHSRTNTRRIGWEDFFQYIIQIKKKEVENYG